jgi:predicted transcriptional regulator
MPAERLERNVSVDDQSGLNSLSRRERQIMTICFSLGEASATDIWQRLPDQPSQTAVRTLLRILEEKGHLDHAKRGRKFIYKPTRPRRNVGRSALRTVLKTFFDGSLGEAVAAHLSDPVANPSDEELCRLADLVREARQKEDR